MNNDLVVIGGGGHAKVVIDIIFSMKKYNLVGITSSKNTQGIFKVPVLGDDSVLPELLKKGVNKAFIAIGDNALRENISKKLVKIGFTFVNVISPFSYISPTVVLGLGNVIMPGVSINANTNVGDGAIINTGASVDHDNEIGNYAHIAPGCHLAGNIKIGQGAFLGVGSNVIPKIHIGDWAILGAGSVVIRNLPKRSKAYGNPAKVIKIN